MIEAAVRRARMCGPLWRKYPLLCVAISVGKPAHEGANLEAAVAMIAAAEKPCLIRLSDTLQRHNLMADGMDADAASRHARRMGDDWLARNLAAFDSLPFEPALVRWDEVLGDPDYPDVHAAFVQLATANEVFRAAIERDVDRFLSRRSHLSREERAIVAGCSRAFLLEELAGQTVLGRRYTYARLYPGKPAEVLELVHDGKIKGAPKGLENTAFVRFQLMTRQRFEPRQERAA